MMPLIGAISSTIFFYSCYVIVRVACKPPSNRWKYSRTSTFYMTLTAMTLAVLIVFVSLMITRSVTSRCIVVKAMSLLYLYRSDFLCHCKSDVAAQAMSLMYMYVVEAM